MTTKYTIYLINESDEDQNFWLFLTPPKELASEPKVFANSSACLMLAAGHTDATNKFEVPVQYVVGAGASNRAVALNVQIESNVVHPASLKQKWEAHYHDAPPNQGPSLKLSEDEGADGTICIQSNGFNQINNQANHWYSSMSFGIQTESGFVGMTWSPSPSTTRTLTPKLTFYVATGSYGASSLADYTTVSNGCAVLEVSSDFHDNEATVTLNSRGAFVVTPGAPPKSALAAASDKSSAVHHLLQSHALLCEAHAGLIGLVGSGPELSAADGQGALRLAVPNTQPDKLVDVRWLQASSNAATSFLTGRITVQSALLAAYSCFILAGIRFKITRAAAGGTSVDFSYSGSASTTALKQLFTQGASLVFKDPK